MNNNTSVKTFTVFSFRLAKTLIKNRFNLVDIGLNNKMKGIVFHFEDTPELQKFIKLNKEIANIRNSMKIDTI